MHSTHFRLPSFSEIGLSWSANTARDSPLPIGQDELNAFGQWAFRQIDAIIGARAIVAVLTDEPILDHQLEILCRTNNHVEAFIQSVGCTPCVITGWSGRTVNAGERVLLPFWVTGQGIVFLWIARVQLDGGGVTTGLHVRWAVDEDGTLVERDADVTLRDWCLATGHTPAAFSHAS